MINIYAMKRGHWTYNTLISILKCNHILTLEATGGALLNGCCLIM